MDGIRDLQSYFFVVSAVRLWYIVLVLTAGVCGLWVVEVVLVSWTRALWDVLFLLILLVLSKTFLLPEFSKDTYLVLRCSQCNDWINTVKCACFSWWLCWPSICYACLWWWHRRPLNFVWPTAGVGDFVSCVFAIPPKFLRCPCNFHKIPKMLQFPCNVYDAPEVFGMPP